LLEEIKKDSIVRRLSGFIFQLEIIMKPQEQEKRGILCWILCITNRKLNENLFTVQKAICSDTIDRYYIFFKL
jgi:hypothetical protein